MTPEIDAAAERLRRYVAGENYTTIYANSIPDCSIEYADELWNDDNATLAKAYLPLTDPTPITPEGLEAEGLKLRPIQPNESRQDYETMDGWFVVEFWPAALPTALIAYWVGGKSLVKTMGGVRLAMMQARESVK